ncbi:MAG: polyprenyl synthetase family protein [Bdellovibrionaceae bacterium]|nr:polyprenyl synthetase family protein [Bdellovibrio sp.]
MNEFIDLHEILKHDASPAATVELLQEFWDKSVFHPWQEVRLRPCKEIRAQFVKLGWLLAGSPAIESQEILNKISQVIETIHLGSLIIDDIQDDSIERRGKPTLHRMYDMPLALNLGNFLYFQAAHLISQLNVTQKYKDLALKQIVETMRDAHLGQALDISINITEVEQAKVPKLVETSLRLKSGALMKLSLRLGALLNSQLENESELDQFGEAFGSCLQKLDDVGNMNVSCLNPKHLEDLKLKRPTWIWSALAQTGNQDEWSAFIKVVEKLPDTLPLEDFLDGTPIKQTALKMALVDLKEVTENLKIKFQLNETSEAYLLTMQLKEKLSHAY